MSLLSRECRLQRIARAHKQGILRKNNLQESPL